MDLYECDAILWLHHLENRAYSIIILLLHRNLPNTLHRWLCFDDFIEIFLVSSSTFLIFLPFFYKKDTCLLPLAVSFFRQQKTIHLCIKIVSRKWEEKNSSVFQHVTALFAISSICCWVSFFHYYETIISGAAKKKRIQKHYDEDVDRKLLCAQHNQMESNERDRHLGQNIMPKNGQQNATTLEKYLKWNEMKRNEWYCVRSASK